MLTLDFRPPYAGRHREPLHAGEAQRRADAGISAGDAVDIATRLRPLSGLSAESGGRARLGQRLPFGAALRRAVAVRLRRLEHRQAARCRVVPRSAHPADRRSVRLRRRCLGVFAIVGEMDHAAHRSLVPSPRLLPARLLAARFP